jgi:hypothetical protein
MRALGRGKDMEPFDPQVGGHDDVARATSIVRRVIRRSSGGRRYQRGGEMQRRSISVYLFCITSIDFHGSPTSIQII